MKKLKEIFSKFSFPDEGNIPINDPVLREAIYRAFKGRDYYTGEPITREDMVIDHIVPRCYGGLDNVYNYVLTSKRVNSTKSDKFDPDAVFGVLYIVSTRYAKRVLDIMSQIGDKKKKVEKRKYNFSLELKFQEKNFL
ncbi:MAG: HNH endonuclease domain-containing protein [Candidatus Pacearchaeota archaeon]